jgi:hypothetical protein
MTDINAAWFVRIEARRLARNAAKLEIRDRGWKVSAFTMKEISLAGEEWFASHRAELIDQAFQTLVWSRFLRAQVTSDAQQTKARKSRLSVVQNIGAE